jgi:hypothetical protein
VCSEIPNSGGRKRQESASIPQASVKPGFAQRLCYGKAAIILLSGSSGVTRSASIIAAARRELSALLVVGGYLLVTR